MTLDKDLLTPISEEALYPLQQAVTNAIVVKFLGEALIWYLVEGLAKVQQYRSTCSPSLRLEAISCMVNTSWLSLEVGFR